MQSYELPLFCPNIARNMKESTIQVSAVGYWNTLPYRYLFDNQFVNDGFEISWDIPSVCAEKMHSKQAQLGLIPIAALPQIPHVQAFSNFGIATRGDVYSVALFSNSKRSDIRKIYLDFHSRTSVRLVQVLAQEYWEISPEFVQGSGAFYEHLEEGEGAVVIGDRAFGLEHVFRQKWDLAGEWRKYTGLPFVFAVWAMGTDINPNNLKPIETLFEAVESAVEPAIEQYRDQMNLPENIHQYLTEHIVYRLDESMKLGMELFLEKIKDLH